MARRPYPLLALRGLRDAQTRASALGLAQQLQARGQAEERLRERASAERALEDETRAVLAEEQTRWAEPGLSSAELAQGLEFEAAQAARAEQLRERVNEAAHALDREREREAECVAQLALAEAKSRRMEQHEQSHHEREAARLERSEEEAALEQWSARKR